EMLRTREALRVSRGGANLRTADEMQAAHDAATMFAHEMQAVAERDAPDDEFDTQVATDTFAELAYHVMRSVTLLDRGEHDVPAREFAKTLLSNVGISRYPTDW